FGTDGIGAPKKFNFYMRHLLPNMDKPHKFLHQYGFSAGAVNEVGNNLMCDYYSNNKLYQKYFLQTLPNMPGAGMLFRDPRIAVKSFAELNRPHLNDGLGALLIYSRPGMCARTKAGQEILKFTPVSHSFMSNKFTLFILASGVLLLLWHIIEFARKNGDAAAALLHFALLMSPLVVFAPGLANHGIEEHLIMDIMYPLLIMLAVNCFIQFFHLLGKRLKSEIYQAVTRESLFFYFVFVMMMAMEYIFRGTLLDIMPVTENLLFQAFVIYCMILPLRIFAGIPCASVVLSYFTVMWGVSNFVKEKVLGAPILPDEFVSFSHVWKTIMFMAGTTAFKFAAIFTLLCLVAAVLCMVFNKNHKFTIRKTVAAAVIASVVVCALVCCQVPELFIPNRASEILSNVGYLFRIDGSVLRFVNQSHQIAISPDDSARELLRNEAAKIAAEQKKYRFDAKAVKPHVVVILNEAGVDPGKFKNVSFPDGSPFDVEKIAQKIKYSNKHDVITGVLQVPGFGGGTVKPEFEVLTGISSFMMPYIPYARVAKNRCGSIAQELVKRGYASNFLHPYSKTFYARHEALPNMGINNLQGIEQFPAPGAGDFPYYPDMDFYKYVVKQIKDKGDKPQFFYCVSMQNHTPYDIPRYRHVPPYKFSTSRNITDAHRVLLQRYLTGIHLTDQAIRQFFIDLEREVKHPTVVVIFGDHYPSLHVDDFDIQGLLDPDFLANNKKSNHKTEYLVWSNFKLPNAQVFTPEMKAWELGRRLVCAAGVVPYNEWIYLFDRLNKSDILMKSRCDIQPKLFNGMKLEEGIDNYFRMYHALSYGEFTGVK
ncbi:MAG: LTA synthase family protein, partial [Lentisphaeria bacterium]|nr:LTA synthase family protein [Lentisphaeria bacterium]